MNQEEGNTKEQTVTGAATVGPGCEEAPRAAQASGEAAGGAADGDERMRVLRMVAEGRITPDEAAELLAALEPRQPEEGPRRGPGGPNFPFGPKGGPGGPNFLYGTRWPFPGMAVSGVGPGVVAATPGGPYPPKPARPPGLERTLIIYTRHEGEEVKARIPLNLIGDAERFLPRRAREHLAESEIDLKALLGNLATLGLEQLPQGANLVHIEEGETELSISIE